MLSLFLCDAQLVSSFVFGSAVTTDAVFKCQPNPAFLEKYVSVMRYYPFSILPDSIYSRRVYISCMKMFICNFLIL